MHGVTQTDSSCWVNSARDCQVHDEKGLIRRAQKNDPEAFAELYEEHFDKIYRYVFLRVGIRAESEDITQQVFLKALQSIASYKWRGAPFSAWLFRIAHNQVIDYHRKVSKVQTTTLEVPVAAADPDPAEIAEKEIHIEQVRDAMNGLTQLQQEVISLRFAGEFSTKETARIMGRSEGAVKALQHSALAALRKMLSGGWDYAEEV